MLDQCEAIFDLSPNEAKQFLGVKSYQVFKAKYLSKLTEGYHYTGAHKHRRYSKARLQEWQQVGHDPHLLQGILTRWKESFVDQKKEN
jgi:hypothetical protein